MTNESLRATDAILLRRAQSGDGAAFATLYDRHAAAAYRVAARLVPSRAVAEDVVQEAFLTLWRSGLYDERQGSVRGYLLAIVHNRAIDRLRRDRRRNTETPLDEAHTGNLPNDECTDVEVERRETALQLRTSVTMLPPAQRASVELAYFGGLTQPEIATQLCEPLGTVKSRIRLGLQKLGGLPEVGACR